MNDFMKNTIDSFVNGSEKSFIEKKYKNLIPILKPTAGRLIMIYQQKRIFSLR